MDPILAMRSFVAVVDQGSFTAAAERLDLSTALVSKYVRQLEQRLDTRLLHRTTRVLRLTESGRAYLERARQLLAEFDELEAAIQDRPQTPRGRLVISAPVAFGESRLAPILADYLRAYPELSIDLRLSDRYVRLVEEGIDLSVRIGRLDDSSLIARRLASARIIVCAAPDYLERRGVPTAPGDLAGHDCILDRNYRNPARWPFVRDGLEFEVEVAGRMTANGARCVRNLALAGAGIARIPSWAIDEDLEAGRLVALFADLEPEPIGIHAVYPERRYLATGVRLLIEVLAQRLGGAIEPVRRPQGTE